MRMAIVGAGSSRLPLMLGSLARSGGAAGLSEVALFDIRPDRVAALLPVARAVGRACGARRAKTPQFVYKVPPPCTRSKGSAMEPPFLDSSAGKKKCGTGRMAPPGLRQEGGRSPHVSFTGQSNAMTGFLHCYLVLILQVPGNAVQDEKQY